jgi:hypothetical protein
VQGILANCSRPKQDVTGLLATLISDVAELDKEIYFTMVS